MADVSGTNPDAFLDRIGAKVAGVALPRLVSFSALIREVMHPRRTADL